MNVSSLRTTAPQASRLGILQRLFISLAAGALIGLAVALVSPGPVWNGWLASSLLAVLGVFALLSAWTWAGGDRLLFWLTALALFLRLVTGIGLSLALPHWGYDKPEQQAGYLFKDAYYRDIEAWKLANSGQAIWGSFREDFRTDQYGGLLAVSALVYRFLSPDAQRPFLVLLIGSFLTALGVPFLRQAVRLRWSNRAAVLAAWIYVLYPDAVYFGSSQLREPFLVGLSAIAFWAVLACGRRRWGAWLALAVCLTGMALISSRVTVAVAGFLGLLFLLEYIVPRSDKRARVLGWIGLVVGAILILAFTWEWFRTSASWDLLVTRRASGQLTTAVNQVGDQWMKPIVIIYGLTRPVLPAAFTEESIPLSRWIGILRAAGWYTLAPFLAYGLFTVWREPDTAKRRRAIWLALGVAIWLVIASARGGGDAIDNPRYRSLFLPWMALLAAWAVDWALAHKDLWLWRWIMIEVIFLGFFTHWYVGRSTKLWTKLPFWQMVVWISALSLVVLAGGWAWDRWKAGRWHFPARVK